MAILLDTTFIIDHLRAVPAAIESMRRLVEGGERIYVNEVVVCEAWTGSRTANDPELTGLLQFLEFVQPGPETARTAGRWRADLRNRGYTLSLADALIAACAHDLDAAVLTRNVRDFARTPVRVETY